MIHAHDWEHVGSEQVGLAPWQMPYTLWSRYVCKRCGTIQTFAGGLALYEPPGAFLEGYGQAPPPCSVDR